jgi:pimeloyl-ACP methyl ester carboxylesterase
VGTYTRTPYLIVHRELQERKEVYGSIDDAIVLQSQLLRGTADSDTALIGMHPTGAPGYLPMFSQLARVGFHVVACATRYSQGDASLLMESVLCDLAACIRDTRERLGYEKVCLVGWSGGGALMAGYQAEAEQRTITVTAAGEPTPFAALDLVGADALILIATHRSRHHLLTGQLDASIVDENDPRVRDRSLDLYDPLAPNQPPYSAEFLAEYRAAQIGRNRSITAWARHQLADLAERGRASDDRCFVVHGTMADPRWLDPQLEPNGRRARWTYLGDPEIVNNSAVGLGRFTSCRSWLSQWSYDDAQVDIVDAGARITVPTLLITAGADDACPPSHTDLIFGGLATTDKTQHLVEHANHYFTGGDGRQHLAEATDIIGSWLAARGLADVDRQ